ncbi:12317_t:CDS:1, partial [Dentiscutata heterogama]
HVTKCNSWLVNDKTSYLKEVNKQAIPTRKRVKHIQEATIIEENEDNQKSSI